MILTLHQSNTCFCADLDVFCNSFYGNFNRLWTEKLNQGFIKLV